MRLLGRLLITPWLLCPVLALLLLGATLIDQPTLLQLEYLIYDQFVVFRTAPDNDRVVLIVTDQYHRFGQGDRSDSYSAMATLLDKVQQLGGETIALLTPFGDTVQESPAALTFKQTLKINHVIIAAESTRRELFSLESFSAASLLPPAKSLPDLQQLLLSGQNPLARYRLNRPDSWKFAPQALNVAPIPPTGHLIFSPDPDGKTRSQALLMPWENQLLPSLPLQLAMLAQGEQLQALQTIPQELSGILQTRSLQIPVIGDYRMLFDIHPEQLSFQLYEAVDLLQDKLEQGFLKDKVILLGPINSYGDRHLVAGYGSMSTSEMAALTTATLLANSAPQRPGWAWLVEAAVLLYFTLLLILLIPRLSSRAGLAILLLFLASWVLAAAGSLIILGIWLKIVPAIILCLSGFILTRWHAGHQERYLHRQENYRVLAQRFQEQGLLDLALEKALLIEPKIKSNKATLYNLGVEFERKRMPHNAVSIYQHLLQAGRFRDTRNRLKQLAKQDQTTIRSRNDNATVILNRSGEKPTLGRYRIERELGQGAMGTVYLGIDPKINRQVAIKTLAYQQVDSDELPRVKERFFREAEAAGNLSHPNIVTIYDVGEEADLAFFAMEFLAGEDLSCYCRPRQRLPVYQVIRILSQTAGALDYAHRQGVIHRDIKPANIVLLAGGQVKVTDFGIAKITTSSSTETGIILGTPSYMSPEQVAGKKVDGRSDLFSLGVVMYELLSGEKPFQGETMTALMYNIANANCRPLAEVCPKLPPCCYTIVDKLLQKTLTRRYKSAAILQQELLELQKMVEKQ